MIAWDKQTTLSADCPGGMALPMSAAFQSPMAKAVKTTRRSGFLIYVSLFVVTAAFALLANSHSIGSVFHGSLVDPDSYMRLVRLEQGLKAGHLANVVQRDDSGVPLVVEWSRVFDAAIFALSAPLAPFLGWHRALFVAGVATGPISMGFLGVALAFAVARLTEWRFLWIAAIMPALAPGIQRFAAFGVIHYHIAQVALVALTSGCTLRATGGHRTWALWAGISGGFAIWLMPETMPWVLLCVAGLGWAWLFRAIGDAVLFTGIGFFATLAAGLALDPPHGGILTVEIDRLSIVYFVLGLATLAESLVLAVLDRMPLSPARRTILAIVAAVCAFGLWLAAYPSVALGPYGLMSPAEMRIFFGHMAETQPIRNIGEGVAMLGPGVMALAFSVWKLWDERTSLPVAGGWMLVAIGVLFATALTARFVIFGQYPASFAVALLPVALNDATRRLAVRPLRAAVVRICLIGCLACVPVGGLLAEPDATPVQPQPGAPSCALRNIAPLLVPAAGSIVLTRPEEVPELLYRTGIIGVGSFYQHGIGAFVDAWTSWRAPSANAAEPDALVKSGARFVLFCPASQDYPLAKGAAATSLWTSLAGGRVPSWLALVGEQKATGFRLYRIQP